MYYFASLLMRRIRKTYSLNHLASAAFMMVALLWLTVSIAFVYPAQQQLAKQEQVGNAKDCATADDDESNPFGNTTEEKASGNANTFSEEYLHDHHATELLKTIPSTSHISRNFGTYNAFHGEVHVPPPNVA